MDGTKLEFPSNTFDIAFSFSSIEHFGGENHSGALKGLKEIERVLKPGGIAVITTEYIINNKEH
jgi:ubiquinone/menaquinone biosynthesis C-methylase UbiE